MGNEKGWKFADIPHFLEIICCTFPKKGIE